ncbi:MAG: hypothetical protein ACXVKN_19825 [Acidimicrobiia bacterium]
MDSYSDMIETAELAIRLRDSRRREVEDRWNAPRSDHAYAGRVVFVDDEIGDDDGPETWEGIFA